MPLKFVAKTNTASFIRDDVTLVFRVPAAAELAANNIKRGLKYDKASSIQEEDGQRYRVISYAKLERSELAEFLAEDYSFAADLLESVSGVELLNENEQPIAFSDLSPERRVELLGYVGECFDDFSGFIEKLVTVQKKT